MKFRCCELALQQVRLLLYKECDIRGRKVLFDSSTIERLPAEKNDKPNFKYANKVPCILEVSNGHKYIYKGQAADASLLGEMIFGAVAMNYKSVALKIHITNDPRRLLCTKIFTVPVRRVSRTDRKAGSGEFDRSKPLSVPTREEVSLSFSLDRGDSGFCGEPSSYGSVGSTYDYFSMFDTWDGLQQDEYSFHTPPGRKLSECSNGSWQRRTFQSMATRFDLGSSSNSLKVPTATTVSSNDSQVYSTSSTSGTTDSLASTSSAARTNKLGLALLITVADNENIDLVRCYVQHSPQLQALVCRLRVATLAAGTTGSFVSILHKASEDATRWLSDLVSGPRLQPVWLNLATSEPRAASKMADTLIADICAVLAVGDTKTTNFFISTLLTHVLTHHLGWVTTVSPYDAVDPTKGQSQPELRPYNALWAQLMDLCGSIGVPPKSARTIVIGAKNVQFVNKLLSVLTYFVRCGSIDRNEFSYKECSLNEAKVVDVARTNECSKNVDCNKNECKLEAPSLSVSGGSNGKASNEVGLKKSTTLANLSSQLSSVEFGADGSSGSRVGQFRRCPTIAMEHSSDSNLSNSDEEVEKKVVFVLGDDEKLVGLKNKSNGGRSVKKSSKVHLDPVTVEEKDECKDSPSQCCKQTLQHSKPIKHSGFKFEFDKYPQIVTNYMKSKNLEILDRHYIGKPGNLKLDNFQFDPTVVLPLPDEKCEACAKCQMMESLLQTPTNASEMEYLNDLPRNVEPQYAKETIVERSEREISPKTFVRKRKENTIIVNTKAAPKKIEKPKLEVKKIIEFPLPSLGSTHSVCPRSGYDASLLGGVTDHYVPDLILQGTTESSKTWEEELRRDLDLSSYLSKTLGAPAQSVAIVADTQQWDVRVVGRECGSSGLSPLVGSMLDALPAMRSARVPSQQCLLYLESKLRELCVLSKTLADMLMSTDFCDMTTLTRALQVDVNDVPLLLAVATTHTPQLATRYGISYR
ncbi:folliculin-interacting protein 2 isoform X2 [Aricia agestis]|uniref:folliculin-interacting protein 2 isoform X2 n=1 Tax=Aricia agestis TaxID=91739 RepID=UPI001C2031A2|nr:folliculin-interacting protein 2 isoform X2 [Aricia agestis]